MTSATVQPSSWVWTPCPNCAAVMWRQAYDAGSGPELSCVNCAWCWRAKDPGLELTCNDIEAQDIRDGVELYAGVRQEPGDQAASDTVTPDDDVFVVCSRCGSPLTPDQVVAIANSPQAAPRAIDQTGPGAIPSTSKKGGGKSSR